MSTSDPKLEARPESSEESPSPVSPESGGEPSEGGHRRGEAASGPVRAERGRGTAAAEPRVVRERGEAGSGEARSVEPKPADDEGSFDLESRVLCSDGSCIGVIGPDGRCKVCGKPGEPSPASVLQPSPSPGAVESTLANSGEAADDDGDGLDLTKRRLCSDGSCIGVIGPDDRCKVCGKPYTGEPEL